jgi:hypothetical protein
MALQRRRQPHREARIVAIEVRWSRAERKLLGAEARRLGLSISSLIRSLVLPRLGPAAQADEPDAGRG